jgi:3-oxoacyl-(acyl-carrier-protein) synthase
LFAEFLERARAVYGQAPGAGGPLEAVVVSGAALGLPGTARVFDDGNLGALLHGVQLIDVIPSRLRHAILDKHITRLVKKDDGSGSFEEISSPADVIKLAARAGALDLHEEFGVASERVEAYDVDTMLAIGAGLDALRDAGIPLVMRYRTTHKGTRLPAGWALPEALRDDTGIIFASAFPGYDAFADEMQRYHQDRARRQEVEHLEQLRARLVAGADGAGLAVAELDRRIAELRDEIARHPYAFNRRFLFRVLSMGHSQFAELIGARGPNTQINSACASTTQAFAVAEDWIRAGRCRRVIVVAADDATSEHMLEWVGAGFLASGAAATDDVVEDAALPFDRRRHGTLLGMGAAAFLFESAGAARERAVQPICEVLGAVTANSAFHGTRLDVDHICQVMEGLVAGAERRWGLDRRQLASQLVFISHETYTPARGGSAAAEVHALRSVFGAGAEQIVVANTKGYTGHPMGVGIEDVLAVKTLETGLVPPIPNYREVDPELGTLNLSRGGAYPIRYALRLGAGFGSQISMSLLGWVPTRDGRRRTPPELGFAYRITDQAAWQAWLDRVSGRPRAELEVVKRTLRVVEAESLGARDSSRASAGAELERQSTPE